MSAAVGTPIASGDDLAPAEFQGGAVDAGRASGMACAAAQDGASFQPNGAGTATVPPSVRTAVSVSVLNFISLSQGRAGFDPAI